MQFAIAVPALLAWNPLAWVISWGVCVCGLTIQGFVCATTAALVYVLDAGGFWGFRCGTGKVMLTRRIVCRDMHRLVGTSHVCQLAAQCISRALW